MRSFLDESRILRNYAINRKIHRDVSVRCRAVQVIQIGDTVTSYLIIQYNTNIRIYKEVIHFQRIPGDDKININW